MSANGNERVEWLACSQSPIYFLHRYCQIYDATMRTWVPFHLWPAQVTTLRTIADELLVIVLKARQLGLSWLVIGYALWLMLFKPVATVLIFSKRDDEAVYLLGKERLRGIYARLPAWMQARAVLQDNDHEFLLSNGSVARAFPTTGGDSYTASLVIVDEADLVPDLGRMMRAVKPTIDAGGQMVLLSRSDKSKPNSEFKKIYRGAKAGINGWKHVFLPWQVRPGRTAEWYAAQKADIVQRTGALDDLHEQYPATDAEALAPRTLDKRIAPAWLEQCYVEQAPIELPEAPAIPGLVIFQAPEPGRAYVLGADPAEGNPTSDDSSIDVQDVLTGEEVATLRGKFQPSALGNYAHQIGSYYNGAAVMVERNNHGHAVLLWLLTHSGLPVLKGYDGREGWLSNQLGKTLLYDACADAFRDQSTTVHSFEVFAQLSSIDGSTLRAPEGELDDLADAYALANVGRQYAAAAGLDGGEQIVVYDERVEISAF